MRTKLNEQFTHCPLCGHPTATKSGTTYRAWYCHDCKREFEPEDDGFVGYGDPGRIVANRDQWQHNRTGGRKK